MEGNDVFSDDEPTVTLKTSSLPRMDFKKKRVSQSTSVDNLTVYQRSSGKRSRSRSTSGNPQMRHAQSLDLHSEQSLTKQKKTSSKFAKIFNLGQSEIMENEHVPISMFRRKSRDSTVSEDSDIIYEDEEKSNSLPNNLKEGKMLSPLQKFASLTSPFIGRKSDSNNLQSREERKQTHSDMLLAIQLNDCKRLKTLLRRLLIDFEKKEKFLLMNEAAYKGCTKCLKTLTRNGYSVYLSDENGWTPLHTAIFSKEINAVKFFVQNNAPINKPSKDGWSPLHLAVYVGDLYITHEIIIGGGDPLLSVNGDVTPFQLAINYERILILDYFLQLPMFLVN